jgi:hypothetical protein
VSVYLYMAIMAFYLCLTFYSILHRLRIHSDCLKTAYNVTPIYSVGGVGPQVGYTVDSEIPTPTC